MALRFWPCNTRKAVRRDLVIQKHARCSYRFTIKVSIKMAASKSSKKQSFAAMQRYAGEGKIGHTQNKTIGFDRYEFSDGSLLVFSPNSAYVVDVNCSMSLRAFLQRLAPNYAAEEAHFIEIKRALREGWSGKG